MRRMPPKIVALILLLVFSQKMGLRLWMHHWVHESRSLHSSTVPNAAGLHLKCDCIDDAMMPLVGSSLIALDVPTRKAIVLPAAWLPPFSAAEKLFFSLKGPPSSSCL
jgi:hypothetical protein